MRRAPLLALGIGAVLLAVSYRASDARRPMPPPTENRLDEEAEERNREAREKWFEEIHRAPGGMDWRKVEDANGRDEMLRRNARKGAPPPPAGAASWVERGSDNLAGRVHTARPSPDGTAIYAGSDLGGLWRRDIATGTWTPLGDNLYGGAHYVLALAPEFASEPDVLLVASASASMHRSDDDGASWTEPSGLPDFQMIATLIETSDDTHAVFFACSEWYGAAWILRSLDGGQTFTTVRELGSFKGSVWTPRDGSSHRLYAVDEGEILTSDDLGDSWDVVGDIGVGGGRAAITGSEAGAPTLWVVMDGRDLYRSDDAGKTWGALGAIDDYWDILAASIGDPRIVAYGGMELHRSANGGATFRIVNRWDQYYDSPEDMLHADMFGLEVIEDEKGGERWLVGTDGGLYESTDRLDTVQNLSLSGLRISQYYSTLTSAADPSHVAAGAQDQGYQLTNDIAQSDDLWSFDQAVSGDYGHLSSADGTHAWVFSTYPGFILVQEGENKPFLNYLYFPNTLESSAWIPPVVADPREPKNFFFAGDRLWYYEYAGAGQWQPSLWSDQDFQVDQYEYLSALAFAPGDPDRAYGVSSYGRLYWSDDAGVTWTQTKTVAFFDYLYGATIAISPADPDVATVGGSGYGNPPVFRTEDGGRSWFDYSAGLPDTTVYAIAESLDNRGTLVAGTQTGAWRRDAGDAAWWEIAEAPAPVTTYWSVEALPSERTFRFGTYGRGIWDYRLEASDACWPVVDEDGDGVACDRDCDDADASILPGLEEKCDGVDVNCDSTDVDESDRDGDGEPACDDCNDDDPTDASCKPGDEPNGGGGNESSGGCSCATTPSGYGGAIALLGALWALRRRRR